jgi:hypothetical protein
MSKRKLFIKFINMVNTAKQCSIIYWHVVLWLNLSLVYDFNTVDFQHFYFGHTNSKFVIMVFMLNACISRIIHMENDKHILSFSFMIFVNLVITHLYVFYKQHKWV